MSRDAGVVASQVADHALQDVTGADVDCSIATKYAVNTDLTVVDRDDVVPGIRSHGVIERRLNSSLAQGPDLAGEVRLQHQHIVAFPGYVASTPI